ncbi:helix-turn-helix transcriptional regulator [Paraburkholderia sp. J63]|uniref:helix-turn-helix transcriptional regulator n=1 Tax=Paraburkholderia sp. J63 TaxID=2805434 RepID=UPI002ABD5CF6|nr:LuxR C-terminal-related transcriptional regulator [Paraburkholderia sp. J63]
MDEVNALVLALYQRAREVPLEQFQGEALLAIKASLPFDVARWGTGRFDAQGLVFHTPFLYNDSPDSLLDYTPIRDRDWVAFHCASRPGVTLNCYLPDLSRHSPELTAYAHRYRHEQGLVTGYHNPATGITASVSLYRAYEHSSFTEGERQLMQTLFPHLLEALRICQRLEVERIRLVDDSNRWSVAVSDLGGAICFAEENFLAAMQKEWPGALPHTIPFELFRIIQAAPHRPTYGKHIVVVPFPTKSLIFLKSRPREPIDNLTAREREIAELVAAGLTHKEVAKTLNIAPSTVNNHLRAIHERVGAHNNAELATQLRYARI